MNKLGSFGNIQASLRAHIEATAKTAASKGASIPTEQVIEKETSISLPASDSEVKDILPSAGVPSEPPKDLTNTGAASGEPLPGVNLSPPTEEKNRKETAPESKLAGINPEIAAIQDRLGQNLKLAAEIIAKSASSVTSLGEKQENPDGSLGNEAKGDTSGSAPVITNVAGVTQTEVPGAPSAPSSQGPSEKAPEGKLATVKIGADGSVVVTPSGGTTETSPKIKIESATTKIEKIASESGAEIDMKALTAKMAQYSQDIQAGREVAHQMVGYLQDMARPEFQDKAKLAEAVQNETMVSTIESLVSASFENGIISQKQADAMMEMAGFSKNPLHAAIIDVQQKIAALDGSDLPYESKVAFVLKCANPDEAMAAVGGAQPPVDPAQMQASIGELLQQLQAAVESGQMTEEQALQVLQQQGVPIEQLLAQGGGDPAAAGAPAGGGDPMAAMGDALGGSPGGAGGAPTPPAAPPIGGDPAVIAPPTPSPESAPSAPTPDSSPKEEKKDGDKEKGDGEKKDESKEDKGEEKKDKDEDKEKSANLIRASLEQKVAAFINKTAHTNPALVQLGAIPPVTANLPAPPAAEIIQTPTPEIKMGLPSGAAPATPAVHKDLLGPVADATPSDIVNSAMAPAPAATPAATPGRWDGLMATMKNPDTLKALLAGGGLAAGGLAVHQLMKGDDEEKKRKTAEPDPAMAAAGAIDPAAMGAAGGAPGADAADPTGGAPSVEQILSEIEAALQSGAITPEQAEEIINVLSSAAGGATGGDPGGAPAGGAAPAAM